MSQKSEAIQMIEALPEDASFEDIQYHLYLLEKAANGLRALDEGRVHTHEEVKAKVAEWTRSSGPTRR